MTADGGCTMKKTFKLSDLDCANCAAKIERAVGDVSGVAGVSVNFMTQKMALEAADDRFDAIMGEVKRVIGKIQPDISIGS